MEPNKIAVTVTGANRVELVKQLRAFADNLDGTPATVDGEVAAKPAAKAKPAPAKKAAPPPADDDDDFKAEVADDAGFDEADETEALSEEDGFDEPPAKTAKGTKTAKPKKLTLDDVNDACKAHAAAKGRKETLAVLQKKFKTQSVTALKPEQYEACVSAMAVN